MKGASPGRSREERCASARSHFAAGWPLGAPGIPSASAKRGAMASNVSEVIHTRVLLGVMLVKRRRVRSPFVGRGGEEATCGRSFRARVRGGGPFSFRGRELA